MRHPVLAEDFAQIADSGLPLEALKGATVLVTGAAGFLGSYLVETLLYLEETRRLGLTVWALARRGAPARARFAAHRRSRALRLLVQDVAAPLPGRGRLDYIIHAASPASPKSFAADPISVIEPNVSGTRALLEAARARRCRGFLYLSSCEVYGRVPPGRLPVAEDDGGWLDPLLPRSSYAEAKRMGEALCAAWWRRHGVPVKIARPFHTYGPGLRLDDGRVFADFTADVLAGRDIVIRGDGAARRPYCYAADATRAFLAILLRGKPGDAYNVANDEAEAGVAELARRLCALFPARGLKVRASARPRGKPYLETSTARTAADVTKLRELGWAPRHSIESGFARTVRSYE